MTSQMPSQTIIGPWVQLIMLDCYETLVELAEDRYQARRGVHRFLAHFRRHLGVPCVVVSDGVADGVMKALLQSGLTTEVSAVYHAGNALETFPDGRVRKRLDRPLADFRVRAEQAVFIGDSKFDQAAAEHHQVPFIRVPRSEDALFSLDRLITGPSNYRSGEFELGFLNRYGRERKP
jgi:phosphoglycolate phosphatase-like HAD superfamily hydrolase